MELRTLTLVLLCAGCSASNLSRQVTRSALDESAQQLTSDATTQELQRASEDPRIRQATQNIAGELVEGMLVALESERAQRRLATLLRNVTHAAGQQVAHELASDPMQDAIGRGAETSAHHAVLGWNAGVHDAWTGSQGALAAARSGGMPRWLLVTGLVVLGLITLLALSLAVMWMARARLARSEIARLDSTTLLLATALRDATRSDELLAVVQRELESRAERTGKHRILDALRTRNTG